MMPIEDGNELVKVAQGHIAKSQTSMTVGELELALLAQFPRADAEDWDRMGLLVGDPTAPVTGVAVALDVTSAAIKAAAHVGANVLLTHHPAFLDPPAVLSPSYACATTPGVNAYAAVRQGVALMNFHTALDVSVQATRLLPSMLSLDFDRILMPLSSDTQKGYGQCCTVRESDLPFKLAHLAARCVAVFGRQPRVWGDMSLVLRRIVIANGSAGDVVRAALAAGADCLVCGEVKYHAALDAAQAGLAIVELGHDVSELPLCALLAQAAIEAGIGAGEVFIVDKDPNWTVPDSTRI